MFFSFGWYSKVSTTESFILKELTLHRIKNFKFNTFTKKKKKKKKGKGKKTHNATHSYVYTFI